VDHPLEAAGSLPLSVWRSTAVVAILVAAAELVLLVVLGVMLLTRGGSSTPAAKTAAPAKTQTTPAAAAHAQKRHTKPPAAHLARARVRVVVLNGNGRPGAAAAAASRVRSHGYKIGKVGNAARMSYARSIVMYRPGFEGEGRRLARDIGIRLVGPLDGMRPSQLQGAQAVLILGA